MFKINNKLTSCSSVSVVNFEQIIADWVQYTDALISNDNLFSNSTLTTSKIKGSNFFWDFLLTSLIYFGKNLVKFLGQNIFDSRCGPKIIFLSFTTNRCIEIFLFFARNYNNVKTCPK